VLTHLAVAIADGGDCLNDFEALLVERAPDELTTRPDGLASIIRAIAA
jgi:hypothetical protein